jgi:hypothetical membrane protein
MLEERISDEVTACAGVVAIALAAVTIVVSVALFDGYDLDIHALSTLGHADRESAAQSRITFSIGLTLTALLGLVFSVGLSRLEQRRLWRAGSVLFAISQGTIVWQVVFPAGVPQHDWLSIFPFFAGALLLLGVDQFRAPETRLFGIVVLSNLAVGLLGAGLLLQTDLEGWAIFQLLGVSVFSIATLLFAARLLGVPGMTARGGERDESTAL